MIGGGVALIGVGVAPLLDRDYLFGVAGIGFGVAAIGLGVGWLLDEPEVRRVADKLRARLLGTAPHSDTDDPSGR